VPNEAWLYGDDGCDALDLGNGGGVAFGGNGSDALLGGCGRDVLVGGEGGDLLVGNPGDDILISAITLFDSRSAPSHEDAWCHVLAEWGSGRTFSQRVDNLRSGTGTPATRLNGGYFLNDSTVNDDAACDTIDLLAGCSGDDWFIYKLREDKVIDLTRAEDAKDQTIT
jgi:hypothetical protein